MNAKRPIQSKTVWFSYIVMILGVAQVVIGSVDMDPLQQGALLVTLGATSLWLRYRSKTPLL